MIIGVGCKNSLVFHSVCHVCRGRHVPQTQRQHLFLLSQLAGTMKMLHFYRQAILVLMSLALIGSLGQLGSDKRFGGSEGWGNGNPVAESFSAEVYLVFRQGGANFVRSRKVTERWLGSNCGGSQLPVTLAPGDMTPSPALFRQSHMRSVSVHKKHSQGAGRRASAGSEGSVGWEVWEELPKSSQMQAFITFCS